MADKPVIIIPSKNIYDIQWSPVVENQIDTIEYNVCIPNIEMGNEAVLNDKIFDGFYVGETQSDIQVHTSLNFAILKADVVCAYVKLTPTYVTKTISIPKQGNNLSVQKILTGYNQYNSANIGYSIYGTIIKGTATGVAHTGYSDNKYVDDLQIQETENSLGRYFIQDSDINVSKTYRQATSSLGHHEVTATVNLDNKSNILTAEATEYADHFEITLTFLSGIEKITMGGWNIFDNDQSKDTQIINMSGEYLKYTPTQLDFTINGAVIKLVLTDEIRKIGNGNNYADRTCYFTEHNELIQSTNTYATQAQKARFMAQSATPKVEKNQLVAQYTINLTDEKTETQKSTPKLKSWNDYYDDETEKETCKYKLDQATPKLNEFYKKHNFCISFEDYRSCQKELEEIVGFKYQRLLAPIVNESVDLTDKYIGNSTEDYRLAEAENENSVVGIQIIPTYVHKTVEIPTFIDNEEVVEWVIGTPTDKEDKDVAVRLYGTVNKGKATNALTYKDNEISFNWEDTEYEQQETSERELGYLETEQDYSLDNGTLIELELDSETDYVKVNSHKTKDYITTVDLTILCGLKVTKLGSTFKPTSKTATMDGVYEEFIPTLCEITIYGNTVAIRL